MLISLLVRLVSYVWSVCGVSILLVSLKLFLGLDVLGGSALTSCLCSIWNLSELKRARMVLWL